MKKFALRALCFALIFVILFAAAQSVLHYRWAGDEDLYTRNQDYAAQPQGSIDYLVFGTSELYAAIDPIVTYHTAGITGYNFAVTFRSAVTAYYQMMYALKHQTPKVVICDFVSMYDDSLPVGNDPLYNKVVDTMPDSQIRETMIRDICAIGKDQSYLAWEFPLLRYHSMWSELKAENFTRDHVVNAAYPGYAKGARLENRGYGDTLFPITPELWNPKPEVDTFSEVSLKYYGMMIEECRKRGIRFAAVLPPKIRDAAQYAFRYDALKTYFDEMGVECFNYNTYEQVTGIGLTLEEDYYDALHLNLHGSVKFSEALGRDLRERFDLPDRRQDAAVAESWNRWWEEFEKECLQ